jgi:hypothetical protein
VSGDPQDSPAKAEAFGPVRVDAPLARVTVAQVVAEVAAVPDGSWTDAIRAVLERHRGEVIS